MEKDADGFYTGPGTHGQRVAEVQLLTPGAASSSKATEGAADASNAPPEAGELPTCHERRIDLLI